MPIREEFRDGKTSPVLVIDINYKDRNGKKCRYRRDAQVQTKTAAREEERRLWTQIALHGEIKATPPGFTPIPEERNWGQGPSTAPPAAEAPPAPLPPEPPLPTFGKFLERYKEVALLKLKPSTRRGYLELLDGKHFATVRDLALDKVNIAAMADLDARLAKRKLSAARRRSAQVVIRSVLRFAVEEGVLAERPKMPAMVKVGRKVVEPFPNDQLELLLSKSSPTARLAFALAAYAGLRAGEVRGLSWSDVNLQARRLVVRRALSGTIESTPKSGHDRIIPLAPQLQALLEAEPKGGPNERVARTIRGTTWGQSGLNQALERACKRIGIRVYHFHTLRHHFVTELFRRGVSAPVVQRLAGHADLSVTQRYAHVVGKDLEEAVFLLRGNGVETGGRGSGET